MPEQNPEPVFALHSVEPSGRADLPWNVTIEGLGVLHVYDTNGTRLEAAGKAQRCAQRMSAKVTWLRTVL